MLTAPQEAPIQVYMDSHRKRRLPSREVLRNALDDYPLLDAIFAQVLYEPRFRFIFASVLVMAGAVFFSTLRLTQSPPGFQPVIKASLIDQLQARSLIRTARNQEHVGNPEQSVRTWALAIARNPAHAGRLRDFLEMLLRQEASPLGARAAASYGPWLLRLTQTNQSDLSLCLQLFAKEELDLQLVRFFDRWQSELPPELLVPRLLALFHSGRFEPIVELWNEQLARIPAAALPEADLFHAASLALAGPGPKSDAAWAKLRDAAPPSRLKPLALRLQLQIADARSDLDAFESAHQGLAEIGQLKFADDLAWLKMLARMNRQDKARLAVGRMLLRPNSTREALAGGGVLCELGLASQALEVLESELDAGPREHVLWLSYGNLLIAMRDWDRLEKAAAHMLQEPVESRRKLAAFARYAEGLAALGQNRRASAAAAFQAVPALPLDPVEGMALVRKFAGLGFPSEAAGLLETLVSRGAAAPEHGLELAKCAFELGDADLLARALEAAHARNPGDFSTANNYAAALLASREHSAEAIRLTAKNLADAPHRTPARINHALALLQNGITEEAAAWLRTVEPAFLEPGDASAYHLARFELAAASNDPAAARYFFDRLDLRFLLPLEIAWVNAQRLRLESQFPDHLKRS